VIRTNETFIHVVESSGKVADLVSEIAAASNEQPQGAAQVNTSVSEMDKVVQQNPEQVIPLDDEDFADLRHF